MSGEPDLRVGKWVLLITGRGVGGGVLDKTHGRSGRNNIKNLILIAHRRKGGNASGDNVEILRGRTPVMPNGRITLSTQWKKSAFGLQNSYY